MAYKITVIPGDGIGKEITDAAVKVLKKTDEKFLSSRGLEQIDAFLDISKSILKKAKKKELTEIKKELIESLDANGVEKVEAFFAEF